MNMVVFARGERSGVGWSWSRNGGGHSVASIREGKSRRFGPHIFQPFSLGSLLYIYLETMEI